MNERSAARGMSAEERAVRLSALKAFFATWRAAAVYDENNHAYQSRRGELIQALEATFNLGGSFAIQYQDDYIFVNGERINYDRDFGFGRSLATRFAELGLGGITINPDASTDQVDRALFALAQADRRVAVPYDALTAMWETLGISGITLAPLAAHTASRQTDAGEQSATNARVKRKRRARALFVRSERIVRDCWERVRDNRSFEGSSVERVVHQLIDEVAHDEDMLLEFSTLKDFDEYTFFHSVNVAIYSIAVGMRLGLDRTALADLGIAALLHDIGKVKLPRDLISKPSEFDDDDWLQMQRHPIFGAMTIAAMRVLDGQSGAAIAVAFEHHLKMDLSGYPKLTRPRPLHLYSRIVTVCDSFDAMTSGRVYQRDRIQPDEAMRRLLYRAKEWYDPLVMKAFVSVVGVFPVGSLVRLSDNSVAVVVRNDGVDLYCPEVMVVRDAERQPCRRELKLHIDAADSSSDRLHIMTVLDPHDEGIDVHEYIAGDETPLLPEDVTTTVP